MIETVVWMSHFSSHLFLHSVHKYTIFRGPLKIQVKKQQDYVIKQESIYTAFILNGYLFYELCDWRHNRALITSIDYMIREQ